MKKSGKALLRPALCLLACLLAASSLHPGMEKDESTSLGRPFASAQASEAASDSLLQEQYDAAQALFDAAEYGKAAAAFEALEPFSNSRARASDSRKREQAALYKKAVALFGAEQYYEAQEIFELLGRYERSRSYLSRCVVRIKRIEYPQAKELFDAGEYESAKKIFESLGEYRDSRERAQAAANAIQAREQAAAELALYEVALSLKEAGDLAAARDTFIEAGDCKDATEQVHSIAAVLALGTAYKRAESYWLRQEYESAYNWFLALDNYEDSAEKAARSKEAWQAAVHAQATAARSSDPSRAYLLFLSLGDYKDSAALAAPLQATATEPEVLYAAADALARESLYVPAKLGFEMIAAHKDSQERIVEMSQNLQYEQALFLKAFGKAEEANALFKPLGHFRHASAMIAPPPPVFSAKQLRDDKTSPKSPVFTAADGTKHRYQIYKGVRTWVEAKAFCETLGGHLATLTTAEENQFVHNFMWSSGSRTAYFGLSDEARVGDWEWVTGEPFVYTNWDPGEPSRSTRERYGMYFYKHTKGTWNDSHFYELEKVDPGCSFICEWEE